MRRTIEIGGYRAIVQYDPEVDMFRGEFIGLNGGADFYAKDIAGLRKVRCALTEKSSLRCAGKMASILGLSVLLAD